MAFLFLTGFAATDLAIRHFIDDPFSLYAEYRSEKLALLDKAAVGQCSAAFGTSHVHNGFDPRAFDSTMREHGVRVASLNLAIEGGSQGEQYRMAKRFLETAKREPGDAGRCFVILEANAGVNMQENNFLHPRAIYTYDREVAELSAEFVSPEFGWRRNLGRLSVITAGTALYYSNTGMLANLLFPRALNTTLLERQTVEDRRGLLPEPAVAREGAEVRRLVASRVAQPVIQRAKLTHGHVDLVASLMQEDCARKFDFVYVVTPNLSDLALTEAYPTCLKVKGRNVPIINAAQPGLYPQLYRPEFWHDPAHLNEAGAAVFSKIVAANLTSDLRPVMATQDCADF